MPEQFMNTRALWLIFIGLVWTGVATGHAVINESEAYAGEFSFITLRITHGCDAEPSKEIRVKIPEGVTRVSPRFKAGWLGDKRMRKLAEPYKNEIDQLVTETVDEIVWQGGELPDGYYGEFQLRVLMPNDPGAILRFKTIQNCENGSIRWIEVPAAGQNPCELAEPAPFVKLIKH
jgi:uncharacterized protein YcnI